MKLSNMKTFSLTISRVDMPLFDGPAVSATVPGVAGEMTIMAGHVAIISPLRQGTVVVRTETSEESFEVESGTLEMSGDHLTILV